MTEALPIRVARILRRLGGGKDGNVSAVELDDGRVAALKTPRQNDRARWRFAWEVAHHRALAGAGITPALYGASDDTLVLEIGDHLQRAALSPGAALNAVLALVNALAERGLYSTGLGADDLVVTASGLKLIDLAGAVRLDAWGAHELQPLHAAGFTPRGAGWMFGPLPPDEGAAPSDWRLPYLLLAHQLRTGRHALSGGRPSAYLRGEETLPDDLDASAALLAGLRPPRLTLPVADRDVLVVRVPPSFDTERATAGLTAATLDALRLKLRLVPDTHARRCLQPLWDDVAVRGTLQEKAPLLAKKFGIELWSNARAPLARVLARIPFPLAIVVHCPPHVDSQALLAELGPALPVTVLEAPQ